MKYRYHRKIVSMHNYSIYKSKYLICGKYTSYYEMKDSFSYFETTDIKKVQMRNEVLIVGQN